MLGRYVWRDLTRNPRRTLATLIGITLGIGLFSSVLFFVDGSSASMTRRAIEPLPIDMQRVLTQPLGQGLELTQRFVPNGSVGSGSRVAGLLDITNRGPVPAHEVVVRAPTPPQLSYVRGSTTRDNTPVPDVGSDSPLAQGVAQTGLNIGSIAPGATVSLTYTARARQGVRSIARLRVRATISSREVVVPVAANTAPPVGLGPLTRRIAKLRGVATAEGLSFVDLDSGTLRSGAEVAPGTVRVFGFDSAYARDHLGIRIVRGGFRPGYALLSAEAARATRVGVGDSLSLRIPGRADAVSVTVGGIVDLSRAKALFFSRLGRNLEDFLYVPNSVIVSPTFFADNVIPAYRTAITTRGDLVRSRPIQEVDIEISRSRLHADPGTALAQTRAVARAVDTVAPGQDTLIDNISNTLAVARDDAGVAKRMFIFLGVPGALLAAALAAYAGGLLAEAQRRESAILRVRGADRGRLTRILALRTVLLTGIGAALGLVVGFLSAQGVLGADTLTRATTTSLVVSAAIGAGAGFLATGAALYAAGRRAIHRDIHDERSPISRIAPRWHRARLDLVGAAVAVITIGVAFWVYAFDGTSGSVYNGRSVSVRLELLVLPIAIWSAGSLVAGRVFTILVGRIRTSTSSGLRRQVLGIFSRSLRRRPWATAGGVIMTTLIVALGMSVASFTASYDHAKVADARFALGSDLRITPSPTSTITYRPADSDRITARGIRSVTPVVFGLDNAVLRSAHNESAANLAAIVPTAYRRVSPLVDANLVDITAARAMAALARDPKALLVSTEMADALTIATGERVEVTLARGTRDQARTTMRVVGLFDRLPGFPEGAGALANVAEYQNLVPSTRVDFFLAETSRHDSASVTDAAALAQRRHGSLHVDSWATTRAKDQSSLAALNIDGLLTLDFTYALAMVTVAITMFVFGLLLQRRREYVTLRAQGMQRREIRALILLEAGTVAGFGLAAGIVVGIGMAYLLVNVLRPLFVLAPSMAFPIGSSLGLVGLVLAATLIAGLAATALVNSLRPTELLRDE